VKLSDPEAIIALMDPALASLLGAVVGGLIGGGSNVGLDVTRAKRERKATEAIERRDPRRAALLIAEELEAGRRLLAPAHERGVSRWRGSRTRAAGRPECCACRRLPIVLSRSELAASSNARLCWDTGSKQRLRKRMRMVSDSLAKYHDLRGLLNGRTRSNDPTTSWRCV
jgi:hypothetical protein